jgi:hypothetical protein
MNYFWKWTDFNSYIQFIFVFVLIGSLITRLLINSVYFIEFLGNFLTFFIQNIFQLFKIQKIQKKDSHLFLQKQC